MTWLREPLVHFLVLGAALFLLHGAVAAPEREEDVIHLTAGEIEQAALIFQKTFQRPPTETELEGLIEDRIREEIYYREALAMGLDKGDTVVRRRLRQKVDFLFSDLAGLAEPTDEQLAAYLAEHPEAFRRPSRVSFRHIYLDLDQRGAAAHREAERLLALLRTTEVNVDALGDRFLLPRNFESVPEKEVTKHFGARFTERLAEVPVGPWVGPVESGFGLHLVQVGERVPGEVPELAEIRPVVAREWSAEHRERATARFYAELRQRYTVNVERPESPLEIAEVAP
jgi:hypothetical protein